MAFKKLKLHVRAADGSLLVVGSAHPGEVRHLRSHGLADWVDGKIILRALSPAPLTTKNLDLGAKRPSPVQPLPSISTQYVDADIQLDAMVEVLAKSWKELLEFMVAARQAGRTILLADSPYLRHLGFADVDLGIHFRLSLTHVRVLGADADDVIPGLREIAGIDTARKAVEYARSQEGRERLFGGEIPPEYVEGIYEGLSKREMQDLKTSQAPDPDELLANHKESSLWWAQDCLEVWEADEARRSNPPPPKIQPAGRVLAVLGDKTNEIFLADLPKYVLPEGTLYFTERTAAFYYNEDSVRMAHVYLRDGDRSWACSFGDEPDPEPNTPSRAPRAYATGGVEPYIIGVGFRYGQVPGMRMLWPDPRIEFPESGIPDGTPVYARREGRRLLIVTCTNGQVLQRWAVYSPDADGYIWDKE